MDVSHVSLRGVFEFAARYLRRGMLSYDVPKFLCREWKLNGGKNGSISITGGT